MWSIQARETGRKSAAIEILPEQPGDVQHTCASIDKAKTLLGYSPQVTFEEGIRLTAEWYIEAAKEGLFEVPDKDVEPTGLGIKRTLSDLELSSYVKRTEKQVKQRDRRVF